MHIVYYQKVTPLLALNRRRIWVVDVTAQLSKKNSARSKNGTLKPTNKAPQKLKNLASKHQTSTITPYNVGLIFVPLLNEDQQVDVFTSQGILKKDFFLVEMSIPKKLRNNNVATNLAIILPRLSSLSAVNDFLVQPDPHKKFVVDILRHILGINLAVNDNNFGAEIRKLYAQGIPLFDLSLFISALPPQLKVNPLNINALDEQLALIWDFCNQISVQIPLTFSLNLSLPSLKREVGMDYTKRVQLHGKAHHKDLIDTGYLIGTPPNALIDTAKVKNLTDKLLEGAITDTSSQVLFAKYQKDSILYSLLANIPDAIKDNSYTSTRCISLYLNRRKLNTWRRFLLTQFPNRPEARLIKIQLAKNIKKQVRGALDVALSTGELSQIKYALIKNGLDPIDWEQGLIDVEAAIEIIKPALEALEEPVFSDCLINHGSIFGNNIANYQNQNVQKKIKNCTSFIYPIGASNSLTSSPSLSNWKEFDPAQIDKVYQGL